VVVTFVSLVAAPMLLLLIVLAAVGKADDPAAVFLARLFVFVPLAAVTLAAAMSAACSVTRERERQTLDGLLTLPGGRPAVLRAKWLGVFGRDRPLAIIAAVPLALGLLLGRFHPLAVPVLAVAVVSEVVLAVTLGLACSVAAGSTTRACVGAGLGLLAVISGPLFAPPPFNLLSPAAVWWTLPRLGDLDLWNYYMVPVALSAAIHAAAAAGVWRWTRRRFDRDADGG
jgi:ABC-type transport system involved in multi-copper enzyme maturation permease subunit